MTATWRSRTSAGRGVAASAAVLGWGAYSVIAAPVTQGWLDAIVGEVAKDVQQCAGGGVFVARGRGRCRC